MATSTVTKKTLKNILAETFWNEVGKSIRPEELSKEVFHYTSLEGLLCILSTKQVWMTNSNFLNDSKELLHFKSLTCEAKEIFKTKLLEEFTEDEINKDDLFNIFLEAFDDAVKNRFDDPDNDFEVYVLSLSDNNDSLTLWGNYAKGKGYSLSFDTKSLISEVDKFGNGYMVYNKVIYKKEQQLDTLSDALLKTFSILCKIELDAEKLKEELLAYFNSLIISYSIFFKHHSFEQEDEFRIAFTTYSDDQSSDQVFFRTNDEAIIPYIKIEFEDADLKGIVIGPKNNSDIAEIGITTFLKKQGFNLNKVFVEKSVIPLRY